jgi:hypothetical protein
MQKSKARQRYSIVNFPNPGTAGDNSLVIPDASKSHQKKSLTKRIKSGNYPSKLPMKQRVTAIHFVH